MKCPGYTCECQIPLKVMRTFPGDKKIIRGRRCPGCGYEFRTLEIFEKDLQKERTIHECEVEKLQQNLTLADYELEVMKEKLRNFQGLIKDIN